jgi:hypothetical protein
MTVFVSHKKQRKQGTGQFVSGDRLIMQCSNAVLSRAINNLSKTGSAGQTADRQSRGFV